MHIKRLYIGDFGIFRNQTLEDLNPGLIVVGGRNRAGKSTFGKILKYLGYGFPGGRQLPPPHVRYQVEADVVRGETNTVCHIRLDGQSEPVCTLPADGVSSNGTVVSVKDIYPVDAFTYRNLFAVSLDQLARVPEGMNSREALQLHSILLGAGLSDIAGIPQMESKFQREARAVGGQTGSLSNKGFQPYMQQIKAGMERKKRALAQVEEYRTEQSKLSSLEKQLENLQDDLKLRQANLDILEYLKGNYEVFEEIGQAAAALDREEGSSVAADFPLHSQNAVQSHYERYQELESRWREQYARFCDSLEDRKSADRLLPLLLEKRNTLEGFHNRLSGLQERRDHCGRLQEKVSGGKNLLLTRMKRINPAWTDGDLDRIEGLSLELLEESRLTDAVSRLRQARDQLRQLTYRKEEIRTQMEGLKKQKAQWQASPPSANLKTYLWTFAVSAVLGIALYRFHPAAGLFLGLFGIAGSALFVFLKSLGQKEAAVKRRELDAALSGCAGQIADMEEKIRLQGQEQKAMEEHLSAVGKELGLAESVAPDGILEYYRALADLRERIGRFTLDHKELEELSGKLDTELAEIQSVLEELADCQHGGSGSYHTYNDTHPLSDPASWQTLRSDLVKWYDRMKAAVSLDNLYTEKKSTEETLLQLIGGMDQEESSGGYHDNRPESPKAQEDRTKTLEETVEDYLSLCRSRAEFLALRQRMDTLVQSLRRAAASDRLKAAASLLKPREEGDLNFFFARYGQYPSREALDTEYIKVASGVRELEDQIERCKEDARKSKNNLERLALTSELEQAHDMIREGRAGLYPVARQYAVWKAAAWLCRDIKNRFMDNMRDELLNNADNILKEFTGGAYGKMIPGDDLRNPDFSFTLADGSTQGSADVLSRGTKEQVFLAVRLGRIMEIRPALPVILDDSLVDFDPPHLKRAVSVLSRLGRTHQIFFLTCHPHQIRLIMEAGIVCQYWQLEDGRFSESNGEALAEHLRKRFDG